MPKKKPAKDSLHLLHSDKRIMEILNASNEYIEQNKDFKEKIDESMWILWSLLKLIPQSPQNFWSGHVFPITEAQYEFESSVVLAKLGFYKHAISSLRNVLELGLLSVYWDIDDKSHIDIQNWVKSIESTPFRKQIFLKLQTHKNIKAFDDRQGIFDNTKKLYERLSNFTHTKGAGYSSRKLNEHSSNVNTFTEASFKKWFEIMRKVLETITIFHVLKYPLALQYTPIEEKFGLDGPMGSFIEPYEMERIKGLFGEDVLKDLQEISDNDSKAIEVTKWINERNDVTEEEFIVQMEKSDKLWIKMGDFENWVKNEKKIYKRLKKEEPEKYKVKVEYWKKLRKWAVKNGHLKRSFDTKTK